MSKSEKVKQALQSMIDTRQPLETRDRSVRALAYAIAIELGVKITCKNLDGRFIIKLAEPTEFDLDGSLDSNIIRRTSGARLLGPHSPPICHRETGQPFKMFQCKPNPTEHLTGHYMLHPVRRLIMPLAYAAYPTLWVPMVGVPEGQMPIPCTEEGLPLSDEEAAKTYKLLEELTK